MNRRLSEKLNDSGRMCRSYAAEKYAREGILPLPADKNELIGSAWGKAAFIFIGAAGIAVRLTAPWVKDKFTDSPVLVIDEAGRYVIPLLSGHVGGGAAMADEIAALTGAAAVHTTATDVREKFAVDVFAVKNGLLITDREAAKRISAAVLEGEKIGLYIQYPGCRISGEIPEELVLCRNFSDTEQYTHRIVIGDGFCGSGQERRTLILKPKNVTAGIGCRKGIAGELLEDGLCEILRMNGLELGQVERLASIDLKKEERAIRYLSEKYALPFITYTADELAEVRGVTTGSDFVKRVAGVDNVCERAALLCCKNGALIQGKCIRESMTAALARRPLKIRF